MMKKNTPILIASGALIYSSLSFGLEHPPRTSSPITIELEKAFVHGIKSSRPRSGLYFTFQSCQSLIEKYYDELEDCHRDYECDGIPKLESGMHTVYSVRDSRYSHIGAFEQEPLVTAKAMCKFEYREQGNHLFPLKRTEKGWTEIKLRRTTTHLDKKGRVMDDQSVTAITAANTDPSTKNGIWMCGADGYSNVKNGQYTVTGMLTSPSPVNNRVDEYNESIYYQIAGYDMESPLFIFEESSMRNFKSFLMKGFIGELHPDTPQIAGDCNSSCNEKAWEVYIHGENNSFSHLTKGASEKNSWRINQFNDFKKSPDLMLPKSVTFTQEVNTQNSYSFLPGGAIFGFKQQSIYAR